MLPVPQSPREEALHQLRREEMSKLFRKFVNDSKKRVKMGMNTDTTTGEKVSSGEVEAESADKDEITYPAQDVIVIIKRIKKDIEREIENTVLSMEKTNSVKVKEKNIVSNDSTPIEKKMNAGKRLTEKEITFEENNLTKEEVIGLKRLLKRTKEGEFCITVSDKSKRFALLKPEQYHHTGLKHTVWDKVIDPGEVKRFQTTLNSHSKWFNKIFKVCSNWRQEERMDRNVHEGGEQACPMTCLIKDHKGWSYSTDTPTPPSRPVVAGNVGVNRCMSELTSLIIEPISMNMESHAIDSTGDMLHLIENLNGTEEIEKLITEKPSRRVIEHGEIIDEKSKHSLNCDMVESIKKRIKTLEGSSVRGTFIPDLKQRLIAAGLNILQKE